MLSVCVHACIVLVCVCVCVCELREVQNSELFGRTNTPPSPESTVRVTTNLGDTQSGTGKGREVLAYPWILLGNTESHACLSRAGLWLGVLPEANRPGDHEQDVPALSSVLQKGAYWCRTCFVLFDDPTDEDSGTWNLSCARFALQ